MNRKPALSWLAGSASLLAFALAPSGVSLAGLKDGQLVIAGKPQQRHKGG